MRFPPLSVAIAVLEYMDTERSRSVLVDNIEVFAAGESTTSHAANNHHIVGSANATHNGFDGMTILYFLDNPLRTFLLHSQSFAAQGVAELIKNTKIIDAERGWCPELIEGLKRQISVESTPRLLRCGRQCPFI